MLAKDFEKKKQTYIQIENQQQLRVATKNATNIPMLKTPLGNRNANSIGFIFI